MSFVRACFSNQCDILEDMGISSIKNSLSTKRGTSICIKSLRKKLIMNSLLRSISTRDFSSGSMEDIVSLVI